MTWDFSFAFRSIVGDSRNDSGGNHDHPFCLISDTQELFDT
jgi:hypothetical protein